MTARLLSHRGRAIRHHGRALGRGFVPATPPVSAWPPDDSELDGLYGVVPGEKALLEEMEVFADWVSTEGGGTGKWGIGRLAAKWSVLEANSATSPHNVDAIAAKKAVLDAHGVKTLAGNFYTPRWAQQTYTRAGTSTNGSNVVQLGVGQGLPLGPEGGGGLWGTANDGGLSIHGPGLTTQHITSHNSALRQISMSAPAGAGAGGGAFTIGGTNSSEDQKLRCANPADAGAFTFWLFGASGLDLEYGEGGNEVQHPLGCMPFADAEESARIQCHMYAGAKKANPAVKYFTPGLASRDDAPAFWSIFHWYQVFFDYLMSAEGHAYWLAVRAAYGIEDVTSEWWCFDGVAAHAYPMGREPGVLPKPYKYPDRVVLDGSMDQLCKLHNLMQRPAYAGTGLAGLRIEVTEIGVAYQAAAVDGRGTPSEPNFASFGEAGEWTKRLSEIGAGTRPFPTNGSTIGVWDALDGAPWTPENAAKVIRFWFFNIHANGTQGIDGGFGLYPHVAGVPQAPKRHATIFDPWDALKAAP